MLYFFPLVFFFFRWSSQVLKPSLNDGMKTCFMCVLHKIVVTVARSRVHMCSWRLGINSKYLFSVSLYLFFETVFFIEPESDLPRLGGQLQVSAPGMELSIFFTCCKPTLGLHLCLNCFYVSGDSVDSGPQFLLTEPFSNPKFDCKG